MIPKSGVRLSDKIMRTKKGGGAPKGASSLEPRHTDKRCRLPVHRRQVYAVCVTYLLTRQRAYRSPLAFRRSAAALVAATERSDSAQAVLHAMKCEGVTFAFGSRLSGAPRAPVVLPAGTMPGPPESGVTSPARSNRTRPIQRLSPVDVPEVGEIRMIVAQTGTDVNGNVTRHKTTGVARSVKRNPRSVIRPEGTSGTQMRGPQ